MRQRGMFMAGAWVLLCVMGNASAAESPQTMQAFTWPDGHRAAVSLAYDDALDSQLDNAIPALDRHGLKGSFYLQLSREPVQRRMAQWRAAAAHGHELGNHTLFHQCIGGPGGFDWVEPQRDLATTTVAQMRDQVLLANTMLQTLDGRSERTMTLPCGQSMARDGDYADGLGDVFVGIKRSGAAVAPEMATLDPAHVGVAAPEGVSGAELIAQVEEAGRRGTMVNFTFHGIGGDYLSVSSQAHEELLAYLAAHRDRYWTDTFLNLMRHVRREQARLRGEPR
jgi:peptidoglycan/xylan/chitin deacetylase (PgdA/CDA1 family)